jgi:hypothetical protein
MREIPLAGLMLCEDNSPTGYEGMDLWVRSISLYHGYGSYGVPATWCKCLKEERLCVTADLAVVNVTVKP